MRTSGRHTKRGMGSFIAGFVAFMSILAFFIVAYASQFFSFLTVVVIPLACGLPAIFFGATSYFSENKDRYGLAGLVLGIMALSLTLFTIVGLSIALKT